MLLNYGRVLLFTIITRFRDSIELYVWLCVWCKYVIRKHLINNIGYACLYLLHVEVYYTFSIYLTYSKEIILQDLDSDCEVFDLLDPSNPDLVVGNIAISCSVEVCGRHFNIGSGLVLFFEIFFFNVLAGSTGNWKRVCKTHLSYCGTFRSL